VVGSPRSASQPTPLIISGDTGHMVATLVFLYYSLALWAILYILPVSPNIEVIVAGHGAGYAFVPGLIT